MNERQLSALKEDSLAGNAVVAFMSALLLAWSWEPSGGVIELPFNLTIPGLHNAVYFAIAALLFVSSFALALASMVGGLRSRAVCAIRPFSPFLAFFVWVAFIMGWLEAVSELPTDQWWSLVLFFGGFPFFLFLFWRFMRTLSNARLTEVFRNG